MPDSSYKMIASIIRDAGGTLVGRTRLQKTVYLLSCVGFQSGFSFSYKHYGPYSEELAESTHEAVLLDYLEEKEENTGWGGYYSIFSLGTNNSNNSDASATPEKKEFIKLAKDSNAVELELLATAVFLKNEGYDNPWEETATRKPQKAASARIEGAKDLYEKFKKIQTPKELPNLN